ncbi:hypothetical protein LY76DRAFT_251122 [Colletotrichum caudatum]|nr:hypothetical protein LY76DRAFT_251122 [Colletotrichum caudatum]
MAKWRAWMRAPSILTNVDMVASMNSFRAHVLAWSLAQCRHLNTCTSYHRVGSPHQCTLATGDGSRAVRCDAGGKDIGTVDLGLI